MPELPEGLYWIHGKEMAASAAAIVSEKIGRFVRQWKELHSQEVLYTPCVRSNDVTKRLWLFRLKCQPSDNGVCLDFQNELDRFAEQLTDLSRGVKLESKKRLLTPLLRNPEGLHDAFKVDVGLHCANNEYNATLSTFWYCDLGGKHHPQACTLGEARRLLFQVEPIWRQEVCDCRIAECSNCQGEGCFECFQVGCPRCDGTGWKAFCAWAQGGHKVKYSAGFPIAVI